MLFKKILSILSFSSHLVLMIIYLVGFRPIIREDRGGEEKEFEKKVASS